MKNIITLLLISIFLSISFINAQNNNSIKTIWPHDDSLKQFFGTIGDIPVEIFLKKLDDKIDGYMSYIGFYVYPIIYKYSENDILYSFPKQLKGSIKKDGEIEFKGFGNFSGKCSGHKIEGMWTNFQPDSLKYPFEIIERDYIYNNWLTYKDLDLGIEFKYPSNAKIKKYGSTQCCSYSSYGQLFNESKNIKKDCIEIIFPVDTNTNLEEREIYISSWQDNSCCRDVNDSLQRKNPDSVYTEKLGENLYSIYKFTEGAMSHFDETNLYSTCRSNDKRCFLLEYFLGTVSLGPFDIVYRDGYYNKDYKQGFYEKNVFVEYNGPKPYNEKLEVDMIEYLISSLKFIK